MMHMMNCSFNEENHSNDAFFIHLWNQVIFCLIEKYFACPESSVYTLNCIFYQQYQTTWETFKLRASLILKFHLESSKVKKAGIEVANNNWCKGLMGN